MIILLHGSDSYRRNREAVKNVNGFKLKYPTASVEYFSLGPNEKKENALQEFLRLKEFCSNVSMFADKKMVVLHNLWGAEFKRGKKPEDERKADYLTLGKEFKSFLKSQIDSKDIIILISGDKFPQSSFAFLKGRTAKTEEFKELDNQKLKLFVKNETKELGVDIKDNTLDFLLDFFKGDLWSIMTEVQKLRWMAPFGKTAVIDMSLLKKTGDYPQIEDTFPFIQALSFPGNIQRKLSMYENMVISREEPAKIFNILQSFNYLSPQLLERLADYDIMVKSGKMDYDDVLLDLIIN